jgi:hypothetical protein
MPSRATIAAVMVAILAAARAAGQVETSPGAATFGTFTFSGGTLNTGVSNYDWPINDGGPSTSYPSAPGIPGPSPDANLQVSGWSLIRAVQLLNPFGGPSTPGDFYWDATTTDRLTVHLATLVGPYSTAGAANPVGPMADFDPTLKYVWPALYWQGAYKTHNTAAYPGGPPQDSATLTAATIFDTDGLGGNFPVPPFANPHPGIFSWQLDPKGKELDIVYTPVPEPGAFTLVAAGLLAAWRGAPRQFRRSR